MKPSQRTIKRHLKDLRALIDANDDPCGHRIAYGMETAIRWVVEDTTGWGKMSDEAVILANILRNELRS